jgi:hypothetical protein
MLDLAKMCGYNLIKLCLHSFNTRCFFCLWVMITAAHLKINAQSGWTKDKGEFWGQVAFSGWSSKNYFNPGGEKVVTSPYLQRDFSLYLEYGLFKRLTVMSNFPMFKFQKYETTNFAKGIGDLRIDFKYGLIQGSFPVSIAFGAEIPTGNTLAKAHQLSNEAFTINLPLGDGEFNVWNTVAVSHSFSGNMYASVYGSYNWRTSYKNQQFADQFKPGLEVGKQFKNKMWIIAKASSLIPIGQENASFDFIRQSGTAYSQYSLAYLGEVYKNWGINLQASGYADFPVKRVNMYSPFNLTFGVFYHLKK